MITVDCTCRQCGEPFTYEKAQFAGRKREFCSTRCASRAAYVRRIGPAMDVGEITSTCAHCDTEYTYVKTTGKRRIYCTVRCKMDAGAAAAKARNNARERVCACGSTDVGPTNKPVCPACKKDQRDAENRKDYNRNRRFGLHGITEAEFNELLSAQRGKCGICATSDPGKRGWFVDHDHECCPNIGSCGNCIRGLLCVDCNFLLGNAKDNQQTLERAIRYLASNSQFKLKLVVSRHDA